jgi:hypothetical protein
MSGAGGSECGSTPYGETRYTYTRAQAIGDGLLIDVTETAKEKGFKIPVAVTSNLMFSWIVPSAEARKYGQEQIGRL